MINVSLFVPYDVLMLSAAPFSNTVKKQQQQKETKSQDCQLPCVCVNCNNYTIIQYNMIAGDICIRMIAEIVN